MPHRAGRVRWLMAALVVLVQGCEPAPASLPALDEVTELVSPAGPASSEPFLFTDEGGVAHLSWMEPTDESLFESASTRRGAFRFRFSARERGGAWSEPRTIAEGSSFSANWANFPSMLRLPDGTLAAHWSGQREEDGPGGFMVSFSEDGGRSWTPPAGAGPDGQPTGSFVALFPWQDGTLAAVWLDDRRDDVVDAGGTEVPDGMTLRFGRFATDGTVVERSLLVPLVCSCCQNAAAVTAEGPVIVYRGRTTGEVRDIGVMRFVDGRWSEQRTLHDDGWVIPACPVNGPAIAARDRSVVVAWFTGVDDEPKVQVKFSDDAGATFGPAFRVDDGFPLGRVDVELLPDGTAVVSWLERADVEAEIRVRRFHPSGGSGPSQAVAGASRERPSGFPRMTLQGEELLFTWTRPGSPGQVLVARGRVPGR